MNVIEGSTAMHDTSVTEMNHILSLGTIINGPDRLTHVAVKTLRFVSTYACILSGLRVPASGAARNS
jgi:hypothetical protein